MLESSLPTELKFLQQSAQVVPGTRWRHYKGAEYEVVGRSVNPATNTLLVTYRSPVTGLAWTIPLERWFEEVTAPNGLPTIRFRGPLPTIANLQQEVDALRRLVQDLEPGGQRCTAHPKGERCALSRGHEGEHQWAGGD
jgi:hypothetical protein